MIVALKNCNLVPIINLLKIHFQDIRNDLRKQFLFESLLKQILETRCARVQFKIRNTNKHQNRVE